MESPSKSSQMLPDNVSTPARFRQLRKLVQQNRPHDDLDLLRHAYDFSARHHTGQLRMSGEPYVSHPLEVAHLLAEMKLDVVCVSTGLLHDILFVDLAHGDSRCAHIENIVILHVGPEIVQ